jgi:beta-phosphoglucomutase
LTRWNGYKAVLFDMDGVILDSMGHHCDLWLEVLAEAGMEVTRDFILQYEGALGPDVLLKVMIEAGLVAEEPPDLEDRMRDMLGIQARRYIAERATLVQPYPMAGRFLEALSRVDLPCALVTSSRRDVVAGCLPDELRGRFNALVTAEDVPRHKPHPDPYLSGASALGMEPGDCLVIENAPAGIASARAAGATCFAVTTTLPAQRLNEAHSVFPDLGELASHLGLEI